MDKETENIEVDDNLTVEEEQVEEEVKDEPETRESVITKIQKKINNFFNPQESDEKGSDIPDEFVVAARKLNWSDEDIATFAADYEDKQLLEMIPDLAGERAEESVDSPKPEEEEKKGEDSQDDEKIQKLLDRIAALEKAQEEGKKQDEQAQEFESVRRASQLFDEASKEFEIFGKTDELPKFPDGRLVPNSPQLKARNEVWGVAQSLRSSGMSEEKAFDVAMNAFKGKNLAAKVKEKVIKGLKKNETKLSGKRVSHESQQVEMNGPDVIREVARRHGQTIR